VLHPADRAARRLGLVITAQFALMAAIITLSPLRFSPTPVNGWSRFWTLEDIALNAILFLPFGFIPTLTRPREAAVPVWRVAALGFGLSLAIELLQFYTPQRYPSVYDLGSNTLGALLGAALAERLAPRMDGVTALRGLALEYPLMGIVHLLVPVFWLIGLGSAGPARAWLVLPLVVIAGLLGGTVFAAERATPTGPKRRALVVAGAAWLLIALLPGAVREWRLIGGATLVFIAAAWLGRVWQRRHARRERRFEAAALRRVAPIALAYLIVSALHPLDVTPVGFHGTWALLPRGDLLTTLSIYRAMERVAAFAVIGYAIAEYRARRSEHPAAARPALIGISAALALLLELARGFHPVHVASASLVLLSVIAALAGGRVYRLQLEHVRALLSTTR